MKESNVLPSAYPAFAPTWASLFGEDEHGIFAGISFDSVSLLFRWIPPGRFWMGSPEDEKGRSENEGPRHRVEITKGYWLGVTPVTQEQWEVVMGGNPSRFAGKVRPVEKVSWDEVQEYVRKLNERLPGLDARLPSEAEWEYGCRAGTDSAFGGEPCTEPRGKDRAMERFGWYDENSGRETQEVGLKEANGWGLYDMHGNVWEWCADGMRTYAEELEVDPFGPTESTSRVLRGGGFFGLPWGCRAAFRDEFRRDDRFDFVGFRLAAGQPEAGERR